MFHHRARIDICAERGDWAPASSLGFARPLAVARGIRSATVSAWLAAGLFGLLLNGLESTSYGAGPLPPTPCPCAADGICRPNRPTWGYSQTRWRSWPGELPGQSPTPVTGPTADDASDQALQPFEVPLPQNEDLRGPAKAKPAESTKGKADKAPAKESETPLPTPEGLPPLFGPQGNTLGPPPGEDTPPELPVSLRQAAQSFRLPPLTHLQQPAGVAPAAAQSTAGPIRPVTWQQPAIDLVNPASAAVASDASTLQQAIYYEASDLPGQTEKD